MLTSFIVVSLLAVALAGWRLITFSQWGAAMAGGFVIAVTGFFLAALWGIYFHLKKVPLLSVPLLLLCAFFMAAVAVTLRHSIGRFFQNIPVAVRDLHHARRLRPRTYVSKELGVSFDYLLV